MSEPKQQHSGSPLASLPCSTLVWDNHVKPRLNKACTYGKHVPVMSEMAARAMVLEILREYGIEPRTDG